MATFILGSQWGDEGKGKLTDILISDAQICARAAGGHNAGHSIKAGGVSYDFHLLPSGLVHPGKLNLIGSGVVFHVPSFFKELETLEEKGLTGVRDRIFVSDRCQLNCDLHAAVDEAEEIERGANAIGSTKRGIGPCYSNKASRSGIRMHEMFREEVFESKLRTLAATYKKRFGDAFKYDVEEEINRFKGYRPELQKYCVDAVHFIKQAQDQNRKILVEGSQALMLDIDYGTYGYVTSSSTSLQGCLAGLALNPFKIDEVVGVVKAYTTRVGGGPFKTEDLGEAGQQLQNIGREIGVSTGRRRRCGWLDLVVVKYSADINNYTALNLTKLDVLDSFEKIQVAVKYIGPDGVPLESFPADLTLMEQCTVEYKEFEGWQKPTTKVTSWYDLPVKAREYVEFIEKFVSVKVKYIGTGPDRDDMVKRS